MDAKQKLKKSLLASTCLAAISVSSAQAAIINESAYGNDFAESLGTATVLPSNTTQVNGSIRSVQGDNADYVQVTGLTPGSQVEMSLVANGVSHVLVYTSLDYDGTRTPVYNSEDSEIITVGSLGLLAFGFNTEGSPLTYSINLNPVQPANVPLAPTAALLGLGVAGMGLRRRKHGAK